MNGLNLADRCRQPEVMDQPGLDAVEHRHALTGLARINRVSRSGRLVWPAVRRVARSLDRPLRVLDVASGAGDIPIELATRAAKSGLAIQVLGLDVSPVAIEFARQRASAAGLDSDVVDFACHDALEQPLPGRFDVIMCSLFLHHLDRDPAIELLRKMAAATSGLLLVNDLRRSWISYAMAQIACRVLTRCRVVHVDGPRSVEGAFTQTEMAELFRDAGLGEVVVRRKWPARMLVEWTA